MTMKDEPPRSESVQCDSWGRVENNSNVAGPKQKWHSVVDVSPGESQIQCYKQHELRTTSTLELPLETSTSVSLTTLKPLTMWIMPTCEKLLKRWEYQTILPVSWETCMQGKMQQLEPWIDQLTGSGLRKEYCKTVYCHPVYLTYAKHIMWNAGLNELQTGIKIAGRNINKARYADDTTLMAESEEELKSLLRRVKE